MSEMINHSFIVEADQQGKRLDQALSTLLPEYSRARIQQWVEAGEVHVNHAVAKNKDKVTDSVDIFNMESKLRSLSVQQKN